MNTEAAFFLLIATTLTCGPSGRQIDQGKRSPMVQSGSVAVEKARIYYDEAG
jgi:hypothetical protein